MQQNFIENQLVILTKQTLDVFLRQENAAELIALYTFYYYTAKWQQTNQPNVRLIMLLKDCIGTVIKYPK